jgi:hypothetical protein
MNSEVSYEINKIDETKTANQAESSGDGAGRFAADYWVRRSRICRLMAMA